MTRADSSFTPLDQGRAKCRYRWTLGLKGLIVTSANLTAQSGAVNRLVGEPGLRLQMAVEAATLVGERIEYRALVSPYGSLNRNSFAGTETA